MEIEIKYTHDCPFNVLSDPTLDGAGDDEHFICKVLVLDDGKRARCNGRDIPPYCPMREGEIILKIEDK